MKLPHAENAVVDIRKLRDYCLDSQHADGKHKARLFAAAFGMTAKDAPELSVLSHNRCDYISPNLCENPREMES